MQLHTERLLIRTFTADDTATIHRILDQAFGDGSRVNDPAALAERASWVQWQILNHAWHRQLYQPLYGELAVVLRETQAVIGAVGLVPCLDRFEQLPALQRGPVATPYATPEVGLFWAIDPVYQGRGLATEAARALITFAFRELALDRIVATTEYDNLASQAVMRRLGMQIERNPLPTPSWLQVVGVLNNDQHN